ncbi:MAG: RnfABCDGE type electron transport complex subunit D [Clostridiales bacterium]|mgnify:CR=1 FL=1|nr:RnfABCDGE type electron transport complex subunit D [Clostridiales bacterium]
MNTEAYSVSVSPHIRTSEDTRSIMLDVIIALIPAIVGSVYFFGWRALVMTAVSAASAVFFEWLYRKLMKKPSSIGDLSAVVTGILLAFCCPVTMPYWMLIAGNAVAIIIVKQLYGGIGKNFMNPALIGRAFMLSWPAAITRWTAVFEPVKVIGGNADAVSTATPLAELSLSALPENYDLLGMFLGKMPGCIGEVSTALLILGALYLLVRKIISLRIPLAFIATVAILTYIFPRGNDALRWMACNLLSGGLVLGAFYMATDYVTSPCTKTGQLIYGVGCGLLTVFIRYFGASPEGVSYAILIMNACSWLLDKIGRPTRFGAKTLKAKEGSLK